MSKKKATLVSENVIRRWGKLANMPALTENFLDTVVAEDDSLEDEMSAAEDEVAAGEAEVEAGEEAEASVEEQEAVERIVGAVVDALSAETGVDIEVEADGSDEAAMDDMDAGMDASDALDDDADDEMDDADAAMRDPAMRDPYNRRDLEEGGMKKGDQSKSRADISRTKTRTLRKIRKSVQSMTRRARTLVLARVTKASLRLILKSPLTLRSSTMKT